jgi:hypothetical protein
MVFVIICIFATNMAGCSNGATTEQPRPATEGQQTQSVQPKSAAPTPSAPPGNILRGANASADGKSAVENKQLPQIQNAQKPRSQARVAPPKKLRDDIKGIYVSPYALQGKKWDRILKLLKDTELNALVIDVKSDHGRITYPTNIETAKSIAADAAAKIGDLPSMLKPLKATDTYLIARIVTFKDPYLAAKKPEWAMKKRDGTVWRDKRGVSWIDPYNEQVWEYNIRIAEEAIAAGFDEVQFDYVRFPEQVGKVDREVVFRNPNGETKDQIIQRFLRTATQRVHRAGGLTSADVFGLTTTAKDGMGIGQKWELLAQEVDAISPMVYPSHYAKGSYGVRHPDLQPYRIVKEALADAKRRNDALQGNGEPAAALRPWLQDFTAKWVKPHQTYKRAEIREQVRALEEQGIRQYLLWNPSSSYSL